MDWLTKTADCRVKQLGEVTLSLECRWHRINTNIGNAETVCLHITEVEELVLEDGKANRSAKLVLVEPGNRLGIPILCVHLVTAKVLPEIAMDGVGSGLDTGVHYSAGGVAEFRTVIACLHIKLSQGVWRRPLDEGGPVEKVHEIRIVIDAVQDEVILRCALSVGDKIAFAGATGVSERRRYTIC